MQESGLVWPSGKRFVTWYTYVRRRTEVLVPVWLDTGLLVCRLAYWSATLAGKLATVVRFSEKQGDTGSWLVAVSVNWSVSSQVTTSPFGRTGTWLHASSDSRRRPPSLSTLSIVNYYSVLAGNLALAGEAGFSLDPDGLLQLCAAYVSGVAGRAPSATSNLTLTTVTLVLLAVLSSAAMHFLRCTSAMPYHVSLRFSSYQ